MSTQPTLFQSLKPGDKFTDGIYTNIGKMEQAYGEFQYIVYKKDSKSTAKAVEQVGYGNTRAVGGTYSFAPNKPIYKI